ncbi:sigma 54-interacting transcriptional regulator [Caballeronia sp. LZ035]|uniref:sigma 54-interacting transcriptional regulator n=1 Tax=Caballeronia sp. LZ035 TaxID=3038568 RepID=UPI00286531B4|nr:sigma 54-interacting transcriptional regulator [Caballeronia sp. LZ035]MDR5757121.1 sigma 54-interacting transcriptional regulator [Caballeronia sp. LZ035]
MDMSVWYRADAGMSADAQGAIVDTLKAAGMPLEHVAEPRRGFGLLLFQAPTEAVRRAVRDASRSASVLAVATGDYPISSNDKWAMLAAGASDVFSWSARPDTATQIVARAERWCKVTSLLSCTRVRDVLIGDSLAWRQLLEQIVEVAAFTQIPALVTGESGTGKELIASLIHDLDSRPAKKDFVVVDCTTLTAELAGSELFGHERGAFTGAHTAREGAFALADGGTLFLDEIGELGLPMQAQLLRVIQESKYKCIGSNIWQRTEFRLVSATNRDLEEEVARGRFRADLYYRIAGCVCRTPPLQERREDILPLARHFLAQACRDRLPPEIDSAVQEYLLTRSYPGNVRDLRRTVFRLSHRHVGPGAISVGDVPVEERPPLCTLEQSWPDDEFTRAVRFAVNLGVGLKAIGQATADTAIRAAVEQENGNLGRAARRLGVTDRALQLRRANQRSLPADLA